MGSDHELGKQFSFKQKRRESNQDARRLFLIFARVYSKFVAAKRQLITET
jgi:hypothetical protein